MSMCTCKPKQAIGVDAWLLARTFSGESGAANACRKEGQKKKSFILQRVCSTEEKQSFSRFVTKAEEDTVPWYCCRQADRCAQTKACLGSLTARESRRMNVHTARGFSDNSATQPLFEITQGGVCVCGVCTSVGVSLITKHNPTENITSTLGLPICNKL